MKYTIHGDRSMACRDRALLALFVLCGCSDAKTHSADLFTDPDLDLTDPVEDRISWTTEPDWLDMEGLIEPWDNPMPKRVFEQQSGFLDCYRPRILSDAGGGIIVVASAVVPCEAAEMLPCISLFAQRISAHGERLWGDSGIRITGSAVPSGDCRSNDMINPHEIAGDGSGGFYIVFQMDTGELDFLVKRVEGDGSESFAHAQPMRFPIDELIEVRGYAPESLGLGDIVQTSHEKLLLSMNLMYGTGDSDYYLSTVNPDWSVAGYRLIDTGSMISFLFDTGEPGVINVMKADPRDTMLGTAWITSLFLDHDGALLGRDSLELPYNSFEYGIVDYDRNASALYLHDSNLVTKVAVLPETQRLLVDWQWVDYGGVQTFRSFSGDGHGGIFLAGWQEVDDDPDERGCTPDTCRSVLIHHWLGPDGTDRTREEDMVLDSFASTNWYPTPLVLRSIGGDILQLWMVPLVHEGSALPDYFSYEYGYYICAQRHGPEDLFLWAGRPCVRVAQVLVSNFRSTWAANCWFDAVEDGVGGMIFAFYSPSSGIMVQRLSPSGEIMWHGRE
jgi:hypothetical protein